MGIDSAGYRSKSRDEFSVDGAPPLAIVMTVCDSAAAEQCPIFLGGKGGPPAKVQWGYPDPSIAEGGDEGKRREFELTRQAIGDRGLQLLQIQLGTMGKAESQQALMEISQR